MERAFAPAGATAVGGVMVSHGGAASPLAVMG